jgi:hypothetical protein
VEEEGEEEELKVVDVHPQVLLLLQEFVIPKEHLEVFECPHGFLEVVRFQVQELGFHQVLVVVLVGQEPSPLYTKVKTLLILVVIHYTS